MRLPWAEMASRITPAVSGSGTPTGAETSVVTPAVRSYTSIRPVSRSFVVIGWSVEKNTRLPSAELASNVTPAEFGSATPVGALTRVVTPPARSYRSKRFVSRSSAVSF